MTGHLTVTPDELAIVREIVASILPPNVSAHVFGSRATGKAKPYSDLDLVFEGPGMLSLDLMARLGEAFENSALPWKVDLVDRHAVSSGFGAIIDAQKVALQLGG